MSSDEINLEIVEQLKNSAKLRGPIEKVVLSADGKLVDGHQRKAADPDWPEEVNPNLKTEEDCVLFEIDKNWHRTNKTESWKRSRIEKLARLGNSVDQVVQKTGIPQTTVYRYYPEGLKDQVKAEAGKASGEARSVPTMGTISQDSINASEHAARNQIGECHNCHLGFKQEDLSYIDGQPYCLRCAPNAHIAFLKKQRSEEAAKEKTVSAKSLDTAEEREARMHVHDSQFQLEVFTELAEEGLTFEQNQKLPVFETEPDGLRYLNEDRTEGLIVYLDNVEIHKGKRIDTDDRLRETYVKHHPGTVLLAIPYKGKSDKEKARVKGLIREKYEFLRAEKQKWKTDISQSENSEEVLE